MEKDNFKLQATQNLMKMCHENTLASLENDLELAKRRKCESSIDILTKTIKKIRECAKENLTNKN